MKNRFLIFACVNLIPIETILLLITVFSALMDVSARGSSVASLVALITTIVLPAVILLLLLIPMYICYLIFRLTRSLIIRALTLYSFWLAVAVLCVMGIAVIVSGIKGVSMAHVDGGTAIPQANISPFAVSMGWLPALHLFILPWVFISFLLMKRFMRDF